MKTQRRLHAVNSIILIVALIAMAAGLVTLTLLTARAAEEVKGTDLHMVLARLAWVATALLCLTLVLLLWAVMRFVRSRIQFSTKGTPIPYVDAWALAGKRFKLPEEDDEGEDSDSEDDDPDDEGRIDLR